MIPSFDKYFFKMQIKIFENNHLSKQSNPLEMKNQKQATQKFKDPKVDRQTPI